MFRLLDLLTTISFAAFALALLPISQDVGTPEISNFTASGQDPMPIPPAAKFDIRETDPGQPAEFELGAVYMCAMYVLYYISVDHRQPEGAFAVMGYTSLPTQAMPQWLSDSRPPTYGYDMIWAAEALAKNLDRFGPVVRQLVFEFNTPGQQLIGHIMAATPYSRSKAFPMPVFGNIVVQNSQNPKNLDVRNTYLAATKVFKEVYAKGHDQPVEGYHRFQDGEVAFQLTRVPGSPRTLSWKDIGKAVIAVLQFFRGDAGFREAMVVIKRSGQEMGRMDVFFRERRPQSSALQVDRR